MGPWIHHDAGPWRGTLDFLGGFSGGFFQVRLGKLIKYSTIGVAAAARSALTGRRARDYLVESLLDQPGLPAKIAQLVAMRSGLDTAHAPTRRMSLDEVRSHIEEESPALAREIDEISDEPHVASLSQVHAARLKSGGNVAIKVQFPGLAGEIASQVDDFIALAARSPAKAYGFTRDAWGSFLREKLLEETNYRAEARYQNEFRESVRVPWLVIPKVLESYSTATILTQSLEESTSPGELAGLRASLPRAHFTDAANIMVEILARSIFQANLIHCDLNPGNYGFRFNTASGSTTLVLYDFGSMQRLSIDQVKNFARMIARARGDIDDDWMGLLGATGFDTQKLAPLADRLHKLMPVLLAPFRGPGKFDPSSWHPGRLTSEIAGADKWWLRTAGPPWFLYLMRALHGWHHGMSLIGEPVEARRILDGFMAGALAASTPIAKRDWQPQEKSAWISSHLRVRVSEGGESIIDLEMPASAVTNLVDLVPDEVAEKITEQGIDLRRISVELTTARAPRGIVFEASYGKRHYRVWLD